MLRFALLAALCLGLTPLAAQDHTPQNEKNPLAGKPEAIEAGKKLYGQTCQACHGGNAAGSERGPALSTGVFRRGGLDGEIFISIRNGVPGTQMPAFGRLTIDQTWQLVSYIRSLSGAPSTSTEITPGNPAAGEALFFGKAGCNACHAVNGRGAIIAPDLSVAAAHPADALLQKIVNPNAAGSPGVTTVKTREGREIRGIIRNQDSFTLHLMDVNGKLNLLDKAKLASTKTDPASLMPANFSQKLAIAEIQNIVAYLKTLTARDLSKTVNAPLAGGLTPERIKNAAAEPHNWLTYWGDYAGKHFSTLTQINPANVKQLQTRWAAQLPGDSILEATPLVVDGILYTTGMPGQAFAFDARTGLQIWKYERKQKIVNTFESNRYTRGAAILGNRFFFGTLDAALVALDARTGLPLWEAQVADTMKGYSITLAPLAVGDKIIVGVAGGEHGIRGFIDAYDAATGKRVWRFNMVPGPGEPGHETWSGDSWQLGGAPTWLTGSFDPETNTLYWTGGNPGPDMDGEVRKGNNLYSCSVVALDATTGQRKWHYQFTPHDTHDWDANQDVILADRIWQGQPRKLLIQANRNGIFYVLDRTNGKLLLGKPYVRQTWNEGFNEDGTPKVIQNTDSTPEGTVVAPGLVGGQNWQSPSYDSTTGITYIVYADAPQKFLRAKSDYEPGKAYWGGRSVPAGQNPVYGIKAIDSTTGAIKWDFKLSKGSLAAGVLATSTGVLFAASSEGNLIALNAKTGALLWKMQTGGPIASSPMSYAVDGKQFIAVSAGGVLYSYALPE